MCQLLNQFESYESECVVKMMMSEIIFIFLSVIIVSSSGKLRMKILNYNRPPIPIRFGEKGIVNLTITGGGAGMTCRWTLEKSTGNCDPKSNVLYAVDITSYVQGNFGLHALYVQVIYNGETVNGTVLLSYEKHIQGFKVIRDPSSSLSDKIIFTTKFHQETNAKIEWMYDNKLCIGHTLTISQQEQIASGNTLTAIAVNGVSHEIQNMTIVRSEFSNQQSTTTQIITQPSSQQLTTPEVITQPSGQQSTTLEVITQTTARSDINTVVSGRNAVTSSHNSYRSIMLARTTKDNTVTPSSKASTLDIATPMIMTDITLMSNKIHRIHSTTSSQLQSLVSMRTSAPLTLQSFTDIFHSAKPKCEMEMYKGESNRVRLVVPHEGLINSPIPMLVSGDVKTFCNISIDFGDGLVDTNVSVGEIEHVFKTVGNKTINLTVKTQIVTHVLLYNIKIVNCYCFEATPIFDLRYSSISNPLILFVEKDFTIRSRKHLNRTLSCCPQSDKLSYNWTLTALEFSYEHSSAENQFQIPSNSIPPGMYKLSLLMVHSNSYTYGFMYVRFIFSHTVTLGSYLYNTLSSAKLNLTVVVYPEWGQSLNYTFDCLERESYTFTQRPCGTQNSILLKNYTEKYVIPQTIVVSNKSDWILVVSVVQYARVVEVACQIWGQNKGPSCQVRCENNCLSRVAKSEKFVVALEGCQSFYPIRLYVSNNFSASKLSFHFDHKSKYTPESTHLLTRIGDKVTVHTEHLQYGKLYYLGTQLQSLVFFQTNVPPRVGNCSITPEIGYVLEHKFRIVCTDWKAVSEEYSSDNEPIETPLLYKFYFSFTNDTTKKQLLFSGYESSAPPVFLPAGQKSEQYKVYIIVEAEDRFGDISTLYTNVTVKLPYNGELDTLQRLYHRFLEEYGIYRASREIDMQISIVQYTADFLEKIKINSTKTVIKESDAVNGKVSDRDLSGYGQDLPAVKLIKMYTENVTAAVEKLLPITNNLTSGLNDDSFFDKAYKETHLLKACVSKPEVINEQASIHVTNAVHYLTSYMLEYYLRNVSEYGDKMVNFSAQLQGPLNDIVEIIDNIYQSYFQNYYDDYKFTKDSVREDVKHILSDKNVRDEEIDRRSDVLFTMKSSKRQKYKSVLDIMETTSPMLMASLWNVQRLILWFLQVGESKTISRQNVAISSGKLPHDAIANHTTLLAGHSISLRNCAEKRRSHDILVSSVTDNVYEYGNNSEGITTGILAISIDINCKVTSRIKHKLIKGKEVVLKISPKHSNYHRFTIIPHDITLLHISMNGTGDALHATVLIKADTRPTVEDYDVSIPLKSTKKVYIIPDEFLRTATGYGFFTVFSNATTRNSRTKRDVASVNKTRGTIKQSLTDDQIHVQVATIGCRRWNSISWVANGCRVDKRSINATHTVCHCNHQEGKSVFASTFYVHPNIIHFDTIFSHGVDLSNAAVYGTLLVLFFLYVSVVILLRKQDIRDIERWAPALLCDNDSDNEYFYLITVHTGLRRGSGTRSSVNFIVVGEFEDSGIRILSDGFYKGFDAGSVRKFIMSTRESLGDLIYLRVWHDNTGQGTMKSWFLNKVTVDDLKSRERYVFQCGRWLALEMDDGSTERTIPVSPREVLESFNNKFSEHAHFNLTDSHLWLSTLIRPEKSCFSRVQRASCVFTLLLLTMISHAMFYKRNRDVSPSQIKIGHINFSLEDLKISFEGILITTPAILCASYMFRKSKSRCNQRNQNKYSQNKHGIKDPIGDKPLKENLPIIALTKDDLFETEATPLPLWCRNVAWFLLFLSSVTSAFFLILYSIEWGKSTSESWLVAFILSLLQSIFMIDPLKVFLIAVLFAILMRHDAYERCPSVNWNRVHALAAKIKSDSHRSLLALRMQVLGRHAPAEEQDLARFRKRRQEEIRARGILMQLLTYGIFAFIIYSISYINRDERSFHLKDNIENILIKNDNGSMFLDMNCTDDYFNWARHILLPNFYPLKQWNNQNADGHVFFGDLVNIKVGSFRMRQVRLRKADCSTADKLNFVRECVSGFDEDEVETADFYTLWKMKKTTPALTTMDKIMKTTPTLTTLENMMKPAWIYKNDPNSLPISGEINTYRPGGYMATFPNDITDAKNYLNYLWKKSWIDRQTRMVVVEFNLYNPNINVFVYVMLIAEFTEMGSVRPWPNIWVFRPYELIGALGAYSIFCYVMFVIFNFMGTISLFKMLISKKKKFFKKAWNIVDMLCVVLGYVGIAVFFIRLVRAKSIMESFYENLNKPVFVNFQSIFVWDYSLTLIIGLLNFIATLRILRILGYNKRLTEIVSVITHAGMDIVGFGFVIGLVFLAYVLFGYLLFGTSLKEYQNIWKSFGSLTNSLIGKNRLQMMIDSSPGGAQLYYFTYVFCVILTLMTMFSAILNHSIHFVRRRTKKSAATYGVIDILTSTFHNIFGLAFSINDKSERDSLGVSNKNEEVKPDTKGKNDKTYHFEKKIDASSIVQLIRDIFVQEFGFHHKDNGEKQAYEGQVKLNDHKTTCMNTQKNTNVQYSTNNPNGTDSPFLLSSTEANHLRKRRVSRDLDMDLTRPNRELKQGLRRDGTLQDIYITMKYDEENRIRNETLLSYL